MKRTIGIAWFLLGLLCAAEPAGAVSLTEVVKANRPSVVYVKVEKADEQTGAVTEVSGTGFVVGKGFVLTAQHVVAGGKGIQVKVSGATASAAANPEPMEVLAENSSSDVAILRFKNTATPRQVVKLGDPWKLGDGDTVYALGFPIGEEWFHTEGKLAGRGVKNSWSTTTVLNPGMSGGPIFNVDGEVVAITWGGVATPSISGINRILPINLFADFLSITGATIEPSTSGNTASKPVEVVYNIDRVQESLGGMNKSTKSYTQTFQAHPGHKIVDFTVITRSTNKASQPGVTISPAGDFLTVKYELTSANL
jgi:S1-C subfamily serine protease